MKKHLVILLVLVLVLAVAAPTFADDFKISGWAHYEYDGYKDYATGDNKTADNELQTRLGFFKQITDNLSFTYQFRILSDYDAEGAAMYGSGCTLQQRLNYFNYKLSDNTTVTIGSNAYWLGGGMLMDDFVDGVAFNTKLGGANVQLLAGRSSEYNSHTNQIYSLEASDSFGPLSITFDYLAGTGDGGPYGSPTTTGNMDVSNTDRYDGPQIVGLVVGYDITKQVNLSVGYAVNTSLKDDQIGHLTGTKTVLDPDDPTKTTTINTDNGKVGNAGDSNSELRVQLGISNVIPKTGLWIQYWDAGEILTPTENGNHMLTWGQQYGGGEATGYRIITDTQLGGGVGLGFYYGSFKQVNGAKNDGSKYGVELYCNF